MWRKSLVLLVASGSLRRNAIAAICASSVVIVKPERRRCATTDAYRAVHDSSNGRQFPEKSSRNIFPDASASASLRFPAGSMATPNNISDWVNAVT
jgi:hypothetical protein